MSRLQLRRLFLFLMLASLGLAALLGLGALLLDVHVSDSAGRVILTAVALALFSLAWLAYAWVWERGRRRVVVFPGMGVAGLTFVLALYMTWADPPWPELQIEIPWMMGGLVWTACLLLLGVLGMARVRRPWNALNRLTQALLVILALLLTVVIIFELDDEFMLRVIGILVVLSACGAISVPVLQRLSVPRMDAVVTTALVLHIVCPRCGKPQELAAGHSRCGACGLRLYIEIEEERCAKCGYVLYRLTSDRCPECGTPVAVATEKG
jgi:ribosomal protein L37E